MKAAKGTCLLCAGPAYYPSAAGVETLCWEDRYASIANRDVLAAAARERGRADEFRARLTEGRGSSSLAELTVPSPSPIPAPPSPRREEVEDMDGRTMLAEVALYLLPVVVVGGLIAFLFRG